MLTLLLVAPSFACGGFFGPLGQVVSSDAQQAILTPGLDSIQVDYRVRYTGTAQDFAWVIPVPGGVMSVEEGTEEAFTALESATAPQVYDRSAPESASGCGCGATNDGAFKSGGMDDTGGVVITGQGFAGDYTYAILAAEDGDSLQVWLADNGFDVATAGSVLDAYTADPRGFEFVAVKIRQDVVNLDVDSMFAPLRITYGPGLDDALHLDFPAMMQRTSTVETNHFQLYVLADGRADVSGDWSAAPLGADGSFGVAEDKDPEEAYNEALEANAGDQRRLALVYAGEYYGGGPVRWVTRYDTIVQPAVETADIELNITDNVTRVVTTLQVGQGSETQRSSNGQRGAAAGLLLGLGALGTFRARHRKA